MKLKFRTLRADELEARVARVTDKGIQLLLYKNARCDMKVLDETVTPMNWQRDHKELKGNMYAGIGIYDTDRDMWVWKWDCGSESNMEGQKGEASDSFKRAGFNWGIGRELYTAPDIWFPADQIKNKYDKFEVAAIEYDDARISYLEIRDRTTQAIRVYGKSRRQQSWEIGDHITDQECNELLDMISRANVNLEALQKQYQVDNLKDITRTQYIALTNKLKRALSRTQEPKTPKSSSAKITPMQQYSKDNYQQISMKL